MTEKRDTALIESPEDVVVMKQPLLGHLLKQAAHRQCQITQEVQLRFDLEACHDIWLHFEAMPAVEQGEVLVTAESSLLYQRLSTEQALKAHTSSLLKSCFLFLPVMSSKLR